MSDLQVNEQVVLHEEAVSSGQSPAEATNQWTAMPRRSGRASLVRASAFSRMNNDEQRRFIAQRFELVDTQELINIVKAIYGCPADRGRPRLEL